MGKQKRSPKKLNQHSQESEPQGKQNGWIKDPNSKLYLPENYLSERKEKLAWLSSIREKKAWDWLSLLIVPALITTIAGTFTLITVSQQNEISRQQNEIFKQRDEAEKERNQQALLIEYLDEISGLVEEQLLTLNDDDTSKTQRTIARARTLSVLRALDRDRKGELILFLNAAQLIERDKPIIYLRQADLSEANLSGADLTGAVLSGANFSEADLSEVIFWGASLSGANFSEADLSEADLWGANLSRADLSEADLSEANLSEANFDRADLSEANLSEANLSEANFDRIERRNRPNFEKANLEGTDGLDPTQIKSACNWKEATFSKKFKQKLDREPDREVDCSYWDRQ